ncbi:MAG: glycosyltransferase 87 family protein, partial [Halobacteriota archaeon]
AALVKLFPAAIGLWLVRIRAWRALVVSIGTGLGGLLLGAFAFGPDLTATYLTEVLIERFHGQSFDGPADPGRNVGGIRRQLAAVRAIDPSLHTPLAAVLLAPLVAWLYRRVDTDDRRQAGILGTILVTLLFFPLQPLYFLLFVYPLVVLLYTVPAGRARTALVAGTVLTFVMGGYETVVLGLTVGRVPTSIASPIESIAASAFTVLLPPTLGMWLLLLGCLLVQTDAGNG